MTQSYTTILETKRLILRHQAIEDLDDQWAEAKFMTMEQVIQFALKQSND
jgi:hypothetical protein